MVSLLFTQRGAGLALDGPLVLASAEGPRSFTIDLARNVLENVKRLRQSSHRNRLVYVYVVGEDANLPDQATRQTIASIADHADDIVGIHEGSGFRASAVRGLITSINLLARAKVHPVICATVQEAAEYLHRRVPDAGEVDEIREGISAFREAVRRTA